MNHQPVSIGLESWIIQDGNYGDFQVGQHTAFALEFYTASGMRRVEAPSKQQLTPITGSEYEAWGRIIHVADDWWVIDFGIPAFQEEMPPQNLNVGDCVEGNIHLGIDPFFYFERLASRPGAPALIANWQVERIQIQTAPFIQQGSVMVRDETLIGWRDVGKTDAWKDDGGLAEYVHTCRLLENSLRHTRQGT